jgi:hypothetical protein
MKSSKRNQGIARLASLGTKALSNADLDELYAQACALVQDELEVEEVKLARLASSPSAAQPDWKQASLFEGGFNIPVFEGDGVAVAVIRVGGRKAELGVWGWKETRAFNDGDFNFVQVVAQIVAQAVRYRKIMESRDETARPRAVATRAKLEALRQKMRRSGGF